MYEQTNSIQFDLYCIIRDQIRRLYQAVLAINATIELLTKEGKLTFFGGQRIN